MALREEIKTAAEEDEYMKRVTTIAQNQTAEPYTTRNGLVFFNGKVVVPQKIRETLMFETPTTQELEAIQESYARIKGWHNSFIGRQCSIRYNNTSASVRFANAPNPQFLSQRGCSNCYPFPARYGVTLR